MKKHKPRPRLVNPVALAIELAGKLDAADQARLKAIVATAFAHLRSGTEPAAQWCVLADALNIAEQLALLGICSDEASCDRIDAGQAALVNVHQRHAKGGTYTLYPREINALHDATWLAGVQLEHCSKGEFERAHANTVNRVRAALAGNAPRGAIVLGGGIG